MFYCGTSENGATKTQNKTSKSLKSLLFQNRDIFYGLVRIPPIGLSAAFSQSSYSVNVVQCTFTVETDAGKSL